MSELAALSRVALATERRPELLRIYRTLASGEPVILYTSGSTGEPRGVVHTHASMTAAARASEQVLGWRHDDRWYLGLSLGHAGGMSIIIRCLLAAKPITTELVDATLASLVPAQLAALLEDPAWRPPPRLRAVLLGGAAAPPSLVATALARGIPIRETYGLTETFGQVATARAPGERPRPLPGVAMTAGTRDAPAAIRIRGPMLAERYVDGIAIAPEFTTADVGFVDDGAVYVVGRADDIIITGGENVHPAQIEAVLSATAGVRAACAFGVPDIKWGQLVAAAITVDAAFDRDVATRQWHAVLPASARPRRLAVVAQLPLLASGKIDRRAVAKLETETIAY